MPRVKSSDSLYKPLTDKVLPQLPRPEIIPEDAAESSITPTIRKVSNSTVDEENEENTTEVMPQLPEETVPYAESAWQNYHLRDARLTQHTLSTNLKTAMDQTKVYLTDINSLKVKYDCLISLYKGISRTNDQMQAQYLRAIDQHQASAQKEAQLVNASDHVLKHNRILIVKCRVFVAEPETTIHALQAACEQALAHAKESSIAQQDKRIPKDSTLEKKLESLTAFNNDITTAIDDVTSVNALLASHKYNLDTRVAELEAEIIKLASKKGSSIFRGMSCFK